MKWFQNLNVGTKIILLIALMSVFLGWVGFTGYYYNNQSNLNTNNLYLDKLQAISNIKEARVDNRNAQMDVYLLFLAPLSSEEEKKYTNDLITRSKNFDNDLTNYKNTGLDSYELEQLTDFDNELQKYRDERSKSLQMAASGDKLEAYKYYMNIATPHLDKVIAILKNVSNYNDKTAKELMDQTNKNAKDATRIIIVLSIVAIILSLTIGLIIRNVISKSLKKTVKLVNEISEGNLAVEELNIETKDEIGTLVKSVNTMLISLKDIISKVVETSEQVALSSEELSASVEENSQSSAQIASAIANVVIGVEQQSNAVNETSAIIEQMSASIQQIAATASQVSQHTNQTSIVTKEGQDAIENAVKQIDSVATGTIEIQNAINKLLVSSHQISDITNVISGIASQTNLLALNAAIEAARAGDAGRGFAVVADEVRKLAEQSAKATTEIASLINENETNIRDAVYVIEEGARDVKLGIEVVNKAGNSFAKVSESVANVTYQIQEISTAIQQMADGSQIIVSSIQEIDTIGTKNLNHTQTVSSEAEEQTASIGQISLTGQNLAVLAEQLRLVINKFHL